MPKTTTNLVLMVFTALSILPVKSTTLSKPEEVWQLLTPSKDLKWHPCYESKFSCAKLDVPLDYHNLELGRAAVPLIRFPADSNSVDGVYKGQLLVNPGGPGASGIDAVLGSYSDLVKIAGSNYDIVGFDPRGMKRSVPLAVCNNHTAEINNTLTKRLDAPRLSDRWMEQVIDEAKSLGRMCTDTMGGQYDAGPHMSTVVNVRDLISITDAFARSEYSLNVPDPSLLNFIGFSYGTIIGQVFASMYPNRVGLMMLDGVVSTDDYFSNMGTRNVNNLDDVFAAFFHYCSLAGPTRCSLATSTARTPRAIFDHFYEWFITLDLQHNDQAGSNSTANVVFLLNRVNKIVYKNVYQPIDGFPGMARSLALLEKIVKNGNHLMPPSDTNEINMSVDAQRLLNVICSDSGGKLYQKTLDDVREQINSVEAESIFGQHWIAEIIQCTGWQIKATDTYLAISATFSDTIAGPFGGNTKTPILFVSNTFDPVTPKANSVAALALFNDSQLLTVDNIGHTSPQTQNTCYFAKAKAYFQNTTMPGTLEDFVKAANLPIGTHHKHDRT